MEMMMNTRNVFILLGSFLSVFLLSAFIFIILKRNNDKIAADKTSSKNAEKKTITEQLNEIYSHINKKNPQLKEKNMVCATVSTCTCDDVLVAMLYKLYYNSFKFDAARKIIISDIPQKDLEKLKNEVDSNLVIYNIVLVFKKYMLMKTKTQSDLLIAQGQQTTLFSSAATCTDTILKVGKIQQDLMTIPHNIINDSTTTTTNV